MAELSNGNVNVTLNAMDTMTVYSYLYDKFNPSTYSYGFNADVDFFDKISIHKDHIIYKKIAYVENLNNRDILYEYNYRYKTDKLYSNVMTIGLKRGILLTFIFINDKDNIVRIDDGTEVAECAVNVYFDCLKYSIIEIKELVKNILKDVTVYDVSIFLAQEIHLLTASQAGIDVVAFPVKKPAISFDLNYSLDLKEKHEYILELLRGTKGVFMFHGLPGSGKTMYIRDLMHTICTIIKKQVIYIPADNISNLSGPEFTNFLSENNGSVFIIEDGDKHIKKRRNSDHSAVDNILNLTDGFLNDCFNIQIIITFNIGVNEIDEALLRNGRLLMMHEFKKISGDQATSLSANLGHNIVYKTPQVLTDVYNVKGNGKDDNDPSSTGFKFDFNK
jgi:hypothetical protein